MQEQLLQFEDLGYAVFPRMISADKIDRIFSELDELLSVTLRNLGESPEAYPGVDAKYLRLKSHHPVMKSHAYDLMKHLAGVHVVANQPEIISFLQVLAKTPVLVDNILIRMDDSTNDRQRPFHQEGLGQISYNSFNLWMPMRDVNLDTGTMKFIPKSHKQGYVPHKFYEEYNNYHGVCEEYIDESKTDYAILKRGDVLIFHPCLFHGSAPMRASKEMRWTLIGRYNSLLEVPYLKSEQAPKHIPQIDVRKS